MTALGRRKFQPAGIPKQRCEIRLPADLDIKLDKIADKAGVTRTALVITAIERLVYGEEARTGVDGLHERVAVLSVGQDRLRSDLLEARAYLDVLGQTMCGADQAKFDRFLDAVEKVKSELMEETE
jgi:predicted transcriptional regulator